MNKRALDQRSAENEEKHEDEHMDDTHNEEGLHDSYVGREPEADG